MRTVLRANAGTASLSPPPLLKGNRLQDAHKDSSKEGLHIRPWGQLEEKYLVEGPGSPENDEASRGRPRGPPGRPLSRGCWERQSLPAGGQQSRSPGLGIRTMELRLAHCGVPRGHPDPL